MRTPVGTRYLLKPRRHDIFIPYDSTRFLYYTLCLNKYKRYITAFCSYLLVLFETYYVVANATFFQDKLLKYSISSKLYVRIRIFESRLSEKTVILKYILRIFYHLKCAFCLDKPSSFGHNVRVKFHVMHRCAQVSRITSKQLNFS